MEIGPVILSVGYHLYLNFLSLCIIISEFPLLTEHDDLNLNCGSVQINTHVPNVICTTVIVKKRTLFIEGLQYTQHLFLSGPQNETMTL